MKRLIAQGTPTELTEKQLDLGGKYFAMSNSGVYMQEEFLQDEHGLNSLFYQSSADCGEDEEGNAFDQEAKAWRDILKKDDRYVNRLKEALPWLFK